MKYLFVFILGAVALSCTNTDRTSAVEGQKARKDSASFTTIQWLDSTTQAVGKISEGQVIEIKWHFKNTGDKPLIFESVTPGCGCTGAEGPKNPVAPGKEGEIVAKFDSKGFSGTQSKHVTVRANNRNHNSGDTDILTFDVEVEKK